MSFLVRALRVRPSVRFSRLCQQHRQAPEPAPAGGQVHCAAALLYFAAVQGPELWAQNFEFISLTWVELRGFEPRTSCMPSVDRPSTAVCRGRSPSLSVCRSPARSGSVAVLPSCTALRHSSMTPGPVVREFEARAVTVAVPSSHRSVSSPVSAGQATPADRALSCRSGSTPGGSSRLAAICVALSSLRPGLSRPHASGAGLQAGGGTSS